MSTDAIRLEVITPEHRVLSTQAAEVQFPTATRGYYGILPGHTPVVTPVGDGLIHYVSEGRRRCLTVFGGVAEVGPDQVTVLALKSELPDQIAVDAVEESRRQALQALKDAQNASDLEAARRALAIAETRLRAQSLG